MTARLPFGGAEVCLAAVNVAEYKVLRAEGNPVKDWGYSKGWARLAPIR